MIHMQRSLDDVQFLIGSPKEIEVLPNIRARFPFDDDIVEFLNNVSRNIMKDTRATQYSDVMSFAFWIRKGSISCLKKNYVKDCGLFRMGRGVTFHIAPSNVPVNFAYSLASSLICGNANIVRVPSKDFEQVDIIADAFNKVLVNYENLRQFVILVRYEKNKKLNDLFSEICDTRVIWGGDNTISEIRKSPIPPRSTEITFADRYSIAVIDSDSYMRIKDKDRIAQDFYNDTFFSDQNACTSPRIVIWLGNRINEAKEVFWGKEQKIAVKKYMLQPIQTVNKLTSAYMSAVEFEDCKVINGSDNIIVRVQVAKLKANLVDYICNSGFFFEYDCNNIMEIEDICNDKRCQTISYIGDEEMVNPLLKTGVKGIDRIVPVGRTMEFGMVWDGYDLFERFTRSICMEGRGK